MALKTPRYSNAEPYYLGDPESEGITFSVSETSEPPRISGALRTIKYLFRTLVVLLLLVGTQAALREIKTSELQSRYLSNIAQKLAFIIAEGPSPSIRFPAKGPYDLRFGYALLPSMIQNLLANGYQIASQARVTIQQAKLIDYGFFPIYKQKTQAGLKILDSRENLTYSIKTPAFVYPDFGSIPKVIVDTLLFIEDRDLLNEAYPKHNPAVEWDRFGKAISDLFLSKFQGGRHVPGGSTLATQLEKFRHSPEGITGNPLEKLRQMTSAALRSYLDGANNIEARKQIALDYINSVPLAAMPGFGEVNGLGDGLQAYFGADLSQVTSLLQNAPDEDNVKLLTRQAIAYRQVLSLFLAHRRPTEYLSNDPGPLKEQVERYLPVLYSAGIIPRALYEAATVVDTEYRRILPQPPRASFLERKGTNLVRAHLLSLLGLDRLYDVDRLDLTVKSTLDSNSQQDVSEFLNRLKKADFAKSIGLEGFRLLDSRGDPGKIVYSFTLFEKTPEGNKLRVETDNFDQPFNINEGVKLDLGSTAKLRTLITYLEIVETLHRKYSKADSRILAKAASRQNDAISIWAIDYLKSAKDKSLTPMLEAAMERKYSANPGERFFTAGGLHSFENFNKDDNGKILSVREATRHSVNLPYIRLMRDIVRYYTLHVTGSTARTLGEMDSVDRQGYLSRFADNEGQVFLKKYYSKYKGKGRNEILQMLLDGVRRVPRRFAAVFYVLNPKADYDEFSKFMRESFEERDFSEDELAKLFKVYSKQEYSLADQGYLARVHPLELWVAAYLRDNQNASLTQTIAASTQTRQEVYEWLFKTRHRGAQDKRIRMMLEAEAFSEIHRKWKNLGYPLHSLVPSYATALGTSADRPNALAELMGIIVNDGKRLPLIRIEKLSFAQETPFATELEVKTGEGKLVLAPEIAKLVRAMLTDVVNSGTAIRLKGGFTGVHGVYPIGGKTGTGDHRFDVYGPGGVLKESRVVNRTATFVFFIGDKFFGTLTAFVHGSDAAKFGFTSALPVQLLKLLKPALLPLIEGEQQPVPTLVAQNPSTTLRP